MCGKEFEALPFPHNRNLCSRDCQFEKMRENARGQAERKKNVEVVKKCRMCGKDVVSSAWCPRSFCDGKGGECYRQFLSENRKEKNNPGYKNGLRVSGKKSIYTSKHLRACSAYKKKYLESHDFLQCEVCGVNQNGTQKFETHHIYFASLWPKHEELHNFKNLILVCIKCHNEFHSGEMRSQIFLKLERQRGLKRLFDNK